MKKFYARTSTYQKKTLTLYHNAIISRSPSWRNNFLCPQLSKASLLVRPDTPPWRETWRILNPPTGEFHEGLLIIRRYQSPHTPMSFIPYGSPTTIQYWFCHGSRAGSRPRNHFEFPRVRRFREIRNQLGERSEPPAWRTLPISFLCLHEEETLKISKTTVRWCTGRLEPGHGSYKTLSARPTSGSLASGKDFSTGSFPK